MRNVAIYEGLVAIKRLLPHLNHAKSLRVQEILNYWTTIENDSKKFFGQVLADLDHRSEFSGFIDEHRIFGYNVTNTRKKITEIFEAMFIKYAETTGSSKGDYNMATWMSRLPDNLTLKEITMPGSHDAAVFYDKLDTDPRNTVTNYGLNLKKAFAICQKYSIKNQLNSGVRYFDIRIRSVTTKSGLWNRQSKTEYRAFHGETLGKVEVGSYGATLEKILEVITNFLKNNPKEFIIFKSAKHTKEFGATQAIITTLKDKNRLLLGKEDDQIVDVKLKELRGKVILMIEDSELVKALNQDGKLNDGYVVFKNIKKDTSGDDMPSEAPKPKEFAIFGGTTGSKADWSRGTKQMNVVSGQLKLAAAFKKQPQNSLFQMSWTSSAILGTGYVENHTEYGKTHAMIPSLVDILRYYTCPRELFNTNQASLTKNRDSAINKINADFNGGVKQKYTVDLNTLGPKSRPNFITMDFSSPMSCAHIIKLNPSFYLDPELVELRLK